MTTPPPKDILFMGAPYKLTEEEHFWAIVEWMFRPGVGDPIHPALTPLTPADLPEEEPPELSFADVMRIPCTVSNP
jgi:hypothetical protein